MLKAGKTLRHDTSLATCVLLRRSSTKNSDKPTSTFSPLIFFNAVSVACRRTSSFPSVSARILALLISLQCEWRTTQKTNAHTDHRSMYTRMNYNNCQTAYPAWCAHMSGSSLQKGVRNTTSAFLKFLPERPVNPAPFIAPFPLMERFGFFITRLHIAKRKRFVVFITFRVHLALLRLVSLWRNRLLRLQLRRAEIRGSPHLLFTNRLPFIWINCTPPGTCDLC